MEMRWYQDEAVKSIYSFFSDTTGREGPRNPLVAMPTGTGKSAVIAKFLQGVLAYDPYHRVLIITHVKELVKNNAETLQRMWPMAPIGIYSAGLKQRDTAMPITFCGIASIAGIEHMFGHVDLIIVDEAHLISTSDKSMYQRVIANLTKINPLLRVIGLTATPFRLGQGYITDGGIFSDICYDLTGVAPFNRLVDEGFLVPPFNQRTDTPLPVGEIAIKPNGEYSESSMQKAFDTQDLNFRVLQEFCYKAADRSTWLLFASGIDHVVHLTEILKHFGVVAEGVHSKMKAKQRDFYINEYKAGRIRALVNNGILTTGFDHPPIDAIGMMRATLSPGLWVQMLGRGTRPSPGTHKQNCLVLDFAGNTKRLGPINDPLIPKAKGAGGGDAPVRICGTCGTYNHASARQCICCGAAFEFAPKLISTASTDEIVRSDAPEVKTLLVEKVWYTLHQKAGRESMKVSYYAGLRQIDEWVCLEHGGGAAKLARDWWRERFPTSQEPPATVREMLTYTTQFKEPKFIDVIVNQKYPKIVRYEY